MEKKAIECFTKELKWMRENNEDSWSYRYKHGLSNLLYPFRPMNEKMWSVLKKRPKVAELMGEIKNFNKMLKRKAELKSGKTWNDAVSHLLDYMKLAFPKYNPNATPTETYNGLKKYLKTVSKSFRYPDNFPLKLEQYYLQHSNLKTALELELIKNKLIKKEQKEQDVEEITKTLDESFEKWNKGEKKR